MAAVELSAKVSLHWFRKGLRLHDNPALHDAIINANKVYPVFCIDPYFAKPHIVGVNRYNFLLESLKDLDDSLKELGCRLFILKGKPEEELLKFIENNAINYVTFERDTEPYARIRDSNVRSQLEAKEITVKSFASHTLHDMERYVAKVKNNVPSSYQAFNKIFDALKQELREPLPTVSEYITANNTINGLNNHPLELLNDVTYNIPSLDELGYNSAEMTTPFRGGEREALNRLRSTVLERQSWVRSFEKPNTEPNALQPSTTVLSPYLKFGCLSATLFYRTLENIYSSGNGTFSKPPVSLHGQLLWREFFYLHSYTTKNFDKMVNNSHCRQIPWSRDTAVIEAWKHAQSGFPFIDAIMQQLKQEGWIHHLARHAVACFLTRGDLWQHWEEGAKVFDLYLLDSDWALNNANWQWLSCSNFFYQYFRVYSPIAFGKKTDKDGSYIRKYLPQLRGFPDKYIYEPWKAPLSVQQQAKCIIGEDYPMPIVDHDVASKENMQKMKLAYGSTSSGIKEESDEVTATSSNKRKATPTSINKKPKK